MKKSVGALASDNEGAKYLMEIEGALASVAHIWSGITLVGIYCGAGVESCSGRKRSLTWDRHMLGIFGQGPCRFRIFGLVLTSVEDFYAPDQSPREDMPCGYVGIG